MMVKIIHLFAVLVLISFSCTQFNGPDHSSYATLTRFLKQENLYQTLDIDKVDVNFLSVADVKDYRPDNKILHDRKLEVTYDLTMSGGNKLYQSKAIIASTDSVVWQMKSLVVKEERDSSNTVIRKTYTWSLNKGPGILVTTTNVTRD